VSKPHDVVTFRSFRRGDGPALADTWTASAPGDGITYRRFRDLFLLDRNFDADGLLVAESDGEIIGAAYGVRRLVAADGADLEPDFGWIPFFFVRPDAQRRGTGRALVDRVVGWLRSHGATTVFFSSYTPNYFVPGLDAERYPAAARLLDSLGFATQYECVAMDRTLNDYVMPATIAAKISALRGDGYRLGTPSGDDLVDLITIARDRFNPDWARAIREAVVAGLPLERIITVRDPNGTMLGWAMHGTYENVIERFGPFGVLPESRGTGLGEALLHLALERMRAAGAHGAWFLWTDEDSAAGHLYLKTGFAVTRRFRVMRLTFPGSPKARGSDEY
jgi:GNAT superfamily N-acetyltransferase